MKNQYDTMKNQHVPLTKWQKALTRLIIEDCDLECIKLFIPYIDDLNFGSETYNPLINSIISDSETNPDIVKYLVSKGANPNTRCSRGLTPIHYLAQRGNLELVKWFCENGADIYMVANNGDDLMCYAKQSRVSEVIRFVHDLIKPSKELLEENEKLRKQNDKLVIELKNFREAFVGQEPLKRVLCDGQNCNDAK